MATINIDGHQVQVPDGLSQEDIDSIVSDYHSVVGPIKDSIAHFPSINNLYKPINLKFGSGEDSHYVTTNNASLNADFTRAFGADSGLFGKDEKLRLLQTRAQDQYDLAKNTSGFDAWRIFTGQRFNDLGTGLFSNFQSKENANETLTNLRDKNALLDELTLQHPAAKIGGVLSADLPINVALQGAGRLGAEAFSTNPMLASLYQRTRALSPTIATTLETAASKPTFQNALIGGVIGASDPNQTAASGALGGALTTLALESPLKSALMERYPNYLNSMQRETIDWAKNKGYSLTPGMQTGDEGMQMMESALQNYKDVVKTGMPQQIRAANDKVTARVILHDRADIVTGKQIGRAHV